MKIYHCRPDSGVYLGCSTADESPLEPGVFLVPAHATIIPPPDAKEGRHAVFDGARWTIQPIPQPEKPEPPPPPTDAQLAAAAIGKRDRLLTDATLAMAPLQDAVELDAATRTEIALLKQWKQYRVAVNRVPDQDGWPREIVWPEKPFNDTAQ